MPLPGPSISVRGEPRGRECVDMRMAPGMPSGPQWARDTSSSGRSPGATLVAPGPPAAAAPHGPERPTGHALVSAPVEASAFRASGERSCALCGTTSGRGPSCPLPYQGRATIVICTRYSRATRSRQGKGSMVAAIDTQPFVVHEVRRWPAGRPRALGDFELRTAPLRIAANLLGVAVANLDCVRDARARVVEGNCPDCCAAAAAVPFALRFPGWQAPGR